MNRLVEHSTACSVSCITIRTLGIRQCGSREPGSPDHGYQIIWITGTTVASPDHGVKGVPSRWTRQSRSRGPGTPDHEDQAVRATWAMQSGSRRPDSPDPTLAAIAPPERSADLPAGPGKGEAAGIILWVHGIRTRNLGCCTGCYNSIC
jgi:hypothetical protein